MDGEGLSLTIKELSPQEAAENRLSSSGVFAVMEDGNKIRTHFTTYAEAEAFIKGADFGFFAAREEQI